MADLETRAEKPIREIPRGKIIPLFNEILKKEHGKKVNSDYKGMLLTAIQNRRENEMTGREMTMREAVKTAYNDIYKREDPANCMPDNVFI